MYAVIVIILRSIFYQDGPSPQRYRGDSYCVCMTLDSGFCGEIGQLEMIHVSSMMPRTSL